VPTAAHCDAQVLAQPSLPKARQWLAWLAYHFPQLPHGDGWQVGVRDALIGLHHVVAISARRLRRNPTWDLQGTMTDDTERLEDVARRYLVRFEQINRRDIPLRFEPTLDCLYGALRQMVRLAREIDRMQRAGKLEVDVFVDTANRTAMET
jgi:hypothetical protein